MFLKPFSRDKTNVKVYSFKIYSCCSPAGDDDDDELYCRMVDRRKAFSLISSTNRMKLL